MNEHGQASTHIASPQRPKMLRVAQAVRIYGVGKTTLWELAKEGKIRVHRLPNSRVLSGRSKNWTVSSASSETKRDRQADSAEHRAGP